MDSTITAMPRSRGDSKVICFYASPEVHKKLKFKVLEEDTTIQDWMLDLVEQAIDEEVDPFSVDSSSLNTAEGELAMECWRKISVGEMPNSQEIKKLCIALEIKNHQELEKKLKHLINQEKIQ